MMDIIDDFFGDTPTRNVHAAVKAALKLAQATLNRYYSRTDDSNVYRIAMSKLFHFQSYVQVLNVD